VHPRRVKPAYSPAGSTGCGSTARASPTPPSRSACSAQTPTPVPSVRQASGASISPPDRETLGDRATMVLEHLVMIEKSARAAYVACAIAMVLPVSLACTGSGKQSCTEDAQCKVAEVCSASRCEAVPQLDITGGPDLPSG